MTVKIIAGGDHAGYPLKSHLIEKLKKEGYKIEDLGTDTEESVDYPDYAKQVAKAVADDKDTIGLLVCGTANGVAMTANKHPRIRAAICWNTEIARLARQHNNANIICLPGRFLEEKEGEEIMNAFLETEFEGGRHEKRVEKIEEEE